jgi:hypothetical protein
MKPGDLAEVTVSIPSVFETLNHESNKMIKTGDLVLLVKHLPTGWLIPSWQVIFEGQVGIVPSRWIKPVNPRSLKHLDEEDQEMSLKAEEFIEPVPDAEALNKERTTALRKDIDGKVRVTKKEAKRIRVLAARLALHLSKDAVD